MKDLTKKQSFSKASFDRMMNPHDGSRKRGEEEHKAKHKYSRRDKYELSQADLNSLLYEAKELKDI